MSITLQEVFENLVYGEFAALSMAEEGSINVKEYNRLITHVNLGVGELYKRFELKRIEIPITVVDGITLYAVGTTNEVIEILSVTTADGVEIPMGSNLASTIGSVSSMTPTTLKFKDVAAQVLTVSCKAKPLPIEAVPIDLLAVYEPKDTVIELPSTYLEALLYFIASRVFNSSGIEGSVNKTPFHTGNNYYAKFEATCALLLGSGIEVEESVDNTRFTSKGFV